MYVCILFFCSEFWSPWPSFLDSNDSSSQLLAYFHHFFLLEMRDLYLIHFAPHNVCIYLYRFIYIYTYFV